jgi:catechol 2,3-dioxygenase-like lactoylglutathione lyase family enzyme
VSRQVTITFDAADPDRLAAFWSKALGYELQPPPAGFDTWEAFGTAKGLPREQWDYIAGARDPDGAGPQLLFLRVPEVKAAKNRVHLDVHCGVASGASKEEHLAAIRTIVDELVAAGATEGASFDEVTVWTVMRDPEGNEFCVV